ncbi:hypothetical protein K523DRAFT_359067 [Schizophyllum commune Tattone D]|nr:hypothetical protein K523DRAFT_359067 [Schizophyllum commune Tattone D]
MPPPLPVLDQHITAMEVQSQRPSRQASATRSQVAEAASFGFDDHPEGRPGVGDAPATRSKAVEDALARAGRLLEARRTSCPPRSCFDSHTEGRQDAPAHAGRLLEARARNPMVIPGTRQALATHSDAFQSRGGYAGEASHADWEPAGACRRRAQRS